MQRNLRKQLILIALSLFFVLCTTHILPEAKEARDRAGLTVNPVKEGIPPKVMLATTALGAFRGIFIDLLWLRSVELKEDGKFYEMVQVYDWITNLQPHYSKLWAHIAWDLAYNVSVERPQDERYFWVKRGIRYLRDKGIPYNQYDQDLYYELSWIYHHKIGGDLDFALRFYRTQLFREMDAVLKGEGNREQLQALALTPHKRSVLEALPSVQALRKAWDASNLDAVDDYRRYRSSPNLLSAELKEKLEDEEIRRGLQAVHLYHLRQELIETLKLDPELMLKLNQLYGPLDWRCPDTHSLYWGYLAREVFRKNLGADADAVMDMKYERLIYFSLQDLVRSGRTFVSDDGSIHNLPDHRFIKPFIVFLQDLFKRAETCKTAKGRKVNVVGAISGYTYALERAVFNAHFQGKTADGEEYLALLRKLKPNDKRYQRPVELFLQANIKEFIDSMSIDRFMGMLYYKVWLTYFYMSMGDPESAHLEEKWTREFHRYGLRRWPKPTRRDDDRWTQMIPPLPTFREEILGTILAGRDRSFTPIMRKRLILHLPKSLIEKVEQRAKRRGIQSLERQEIR
ncbi:MAG: hypothetical protein ACYTGH_05175 [Planctomycetota bacterium]|jgi:hypothetical protein